MQPDAGAHEQQLHQRDPTGRFTGRGPEYRRFRPSYPPAVIDAVLGGLGDPARLAAADVGAGTGISATLLADRGVRVFAIEPNQAMRAEAEAHPLVEWIPASAEHTTLTQASVDLVLCAQAFHWFEPTAALAEFARVLRPSGRVALVWNDRDERDAFTRAYGDLLRIASQHDPVVEGHTRPEPLFTSPLFANARRLEFANDQRLDLDGLVGRALSASYIPRSGPRLNALVAGLHAAHERFRDKSGDIRLVYVTRVFLAEVALQAGPS